MLLVVEVNEFDIELVEIRQIHAINKRVVHMVTSSRSNFAIHGDVVSIIFEIDCLRLNELNYSSIFSVATSDEHLCPAGQVWNNCSNACGHTCTTLPCRSCNEPSTCESGCVCKSPLVMNEFGECIENSQCVCQTNGGVTQLVPGQTIIDQRRCELWFDE